MNSPHLPSSPPKRFRLSSIHLTFVAVLSVHAAAFALMFGGESDVDTSSPKTAHNESDTANVEGQNIDSLIPEEVDEFRLGGPPVEPHIEATSPLRGVENLPVSPLETEPSPANPGGPEPAVVAPVDPTPIRVATFAEESDSERAFDQVVKKAFHDAWERPLELEITPGNSTAKLDVTIGRDGKVERFALAGLTGVPELDSSVLAAARSVRKITPLPEAYEGESYDVTIDFPLD